MDKQQIEAIAWDVARRRAERHEVAAMAAALVRAVEAQIAAARGWQRPEAQRGNA